MSKEDAADDLKGLVFEELIEGKIERKYDTQTTNALFESITAAPRVDDAGHGADEAIDESAEDPVDTDDGDAPQQQPQDDGFGFDLNAAVPPLNIRLPAMEFTMKESGFAFPEEIRQEAKPFAIDEAKPMLARPILLSLDGVDKMTETEVRKFCRKFGKDGYSKYIHYDDYTEELEDAVHDLLDAVDAGTAQASGADDVPKKPYACATWSETDNTFTISVKDRFDTSGNYFMLYCVKDNKQLMPTI